MMCYVLHVSCYIALTSAKFYLDFVNNNLSNKHHKNVANKPISNVLSIIGASLDTSAIYCVVPLGRHSPIVDCSIRVY